MLRQEILNVRRENKLHSSTLAESKQNWKVEPPAIQVAVNRVTVFEAAISDQASPPSNTAERRSRQSEPSLTPVKSAVCGGEDLSRNQQRNLSTVTK